MENTKDNKKAANKKLFITVGAFIGVIVVVLCILVVFKKNQENKQNNIPTETTEAAMTEIVDESTTTFKTTDLTKPDLEEYNWPREELDKIDAFVTGTYYIDCTIRTDETDTDQNQSMKLAKRGKNFQMETELDGMSMSVMLLNSKFYMVNSKKAQYLAIDKNLLDTMGIDTAEITQEFDTLDFSKFNFTSVKRELSELDDEDCSKYILTVDDSENIIFYLVNGDIKKIEMADVDGEVGCIIDVNDFDMTVPKNMLTLNGLYPTTMMGFVTGLGITVDDPEALEELE